MASLISINEAKKFKSLDILIRVKHIELELIFGQTAALFITDGIISWKQL